jgi:predicted nucleotide-binding protein
MATGTKGGTGTPERQRAPVAPKQGNPTGSPKAPASTPAAKPATAQQRMRQSDAPSMALEEALDVATAIVDQYGSKPTTPLDLGVAVGIQPSTGHFKTLVTASAAYGLTEGGSSSAEIKVTPLAKRILRPTVEGDDVVARREAFLTPRIIKEFLSQYNGHKLAREDIAINVLVKLGVPEGAGKRTFALIVAGAKATGILKDINGVPHVSLAGGQPAGEAVSAAEAPAAVDLDTASIPDGALAEHASDSTRVPRQDLRRVFITHGSNKAFIEPLKDLLAFGELEAIVSVERESVALPVPDKVMNDMRSCSAAIIHVDAEQKLMDADMKVVVVLNPNVLIEIGAAMALFGRRFILLVKEGVGLPSNLQGLYEVRYQGDKLDSDATIRLLKAIKDIKNHPLPAKQ